MIYAVLSHFDLVMKFTVTTLNKDFINAGQGWKISIGNVHRQSDFLKLAWITLCKYTPSLPQ